MRRIAENLATLLASQVASWGATMIAIIVAPHFLGDVQYGRLSFVTYFVGFFGIVANLGSVPFIAKATARDVSVQGAYVFNAIALKVPLCVALSLVAVASIWALGYSVEMCLVTAACCVGMVLGVLTGSLFAGLQGEERMGASAVSAAVARYASTAAYLAALAARRGLLLVVLAPAATGVIPLVVNGAQLLPRLRAARVDLGLWRILLLGGLPFLMWDVALTVYGTVDIVMLSWMAGDAVVGWYTIAYKLVGIPAFLPSLIVTTFMPALAALGVRITPEFVRLANRSLRLVFVTCAPMAAGIALVAGDLIPFLRYPAAFAHSVPLIRILSVHVPLVAIDTVMGAIIMANDRQKRWVVVGCVAAVLNPLLNLAAIPLATEAFGNGAVGASVVTVLTEVFMLGGALYLRPHGVLDRATIAYMGRCALACLPMLVAVAFAGEVWLPAKVAAGAGAYALACVALRTVSLRDVLEAGMAGPSPARAPSASGAR